MIIEKNIPLSKYTTFKIGGPAKFFCKVESEKDVLEALKFAKDKNIPYFVLGGGSNILVSDQGYSGLVIKMEILGITFKDSHVIAGAGESWDDFVARTIAEGFSGLENLSSIPGRVGAAPVQNLGAYGTDAGDFIASVRALDTTTGQFVNLSKNDCQFEYRGSLFKNEKGRYIVTAVEFELRKDGSVNIDYKDLKDHFANLKIARPSPQQVRDAVIQIRSAKLPDWKVWGTAGSFFKNPIVSVRQFEELKKKYPELPGFPEKDGMVKVSLGWILDKICKAKGLIEGNVGTYEKQALVIIAMPGATSEDVIRLSQELMQMVKEKTGIEIEAEVEWVN